MPIMYLFGPMVAAGRLKSIEMIIKKAVCALKSFMMFGAPMVFAFCTAVLVKAAWQSYSGKENHEKKLTFISSIAWGFFGVLTLTLCLGIELSNILAVIFSLVTLVFALIIPTIIALVYVYSAIFCCDESACPRRVFSHHPPLSVKISLLVYLGLACYWLVRSSSKECFEQYKKTQKGHKQKNQKLLGLFLGADGKKS